jgi:hypothetical protein
MGRSLSPAHQSSSFAALSQCQPPSMLYAFTDESYNSKYYLQGALIMHESELPRLERLIIEVKDRARFYGVCESAEIHGHSIMQGVHGWEPLAGKLKLRLSIYKQLLHGLTGFNVKLLLVGVEIAPLMKTGETMADLHLESYKILLDVIESYAQLKAEDVEVLSDKISYEKKINNLIKNFREKPKESSYEDFVRNIVKIEHVDSHLSVGVQMTDVALYIFNRLLLDEKSHIRARKEAQNLWKILEQIIDEEFAPRILRP